MKRLNKRKLTAAAVSLTILGGTLVSAPPTFANTNSEVGVQSKLSQNPIDENGNPVQQKQLLTADELNQMANKTILTGYDKDIYNSFVDRVKKLQNEPANMLDMRSYIADLYVINYAYDRAIKGEAFSKISFTILSATMKRALLNNNIYFNWKKGEIKNIGDPIVNILDPQGVFIGEDAWKNATGSIQKWNTVKMDKKITNKMTKKISHGFDLKIPVEVVYGAAEFAFDATYKYSNEQTEEKGSELNYVIPSQPVEIQADHYAIAKGSAILADFKADVSLYGEFSATINPDAGIGNPTSVFQVLAAYKNNLAQGISVIDGGTIVLDGKGTMNGSGMGASKYSFEVEEYKIGTGPHPEWGGNGSAKNEKPTKVTEMQLDEKGNVLEKSVK
ncbi:ETX/MTX2 family pore-forming toxin [Bacillus cereus]|uniref:Uncharacterized protein n=1 Tax=Bacillus cereus VD184 TaxID=1053242 RepID=A0A9W5R294_BACCE|nr:ETX/MTX2 family pore-forming toxin [Bacillus cereus]EOQ05473.1 hypothetical protein IKC_06317 [Bacillus cereus VD184]